MQYLSPIPFDAKGNFTDHDWKYVSRNAYSVDGYGPVLVTIMVGEFTARVHVKCLPGVYVWRAPDAASRRRLLDRVLKPMGLRRVGRVEEFGSGWLWKYDLAPLG